MLKVKDANRFVWETILANLEVDIDNIKDGAVAFNGSEKDKEKYINAIKRAMDVAAKKVRMYS